MTMAKCRYELIYLFHGWPTGAAIISSTCGMWPLVFERLEKWMVEWLNENKQIIPKNHDNRELITTLRFNHEGFRRCFFFFSVEKFFENSVKIIVWKKITTDFAATFSLLFFASFPNERLYLVRFPLLLLLQCVLSISCIVFINRK